MSKKIEKLLAETKVLLGKKPKFSTDITYYDLVETYTALLLQNIIVDMLHDDVPLSNKQVEIISKYLEE